MRAATETFTILENWQDPESRLSGKQMLRIQQADSVHGLRISAEPDEPSWG